MGVRDLYNSIRNYLRLSVRVVEREGGDINEGEEFTVRCTITNIAPPAHHTNDPEIIFTDPDIRVEGGNHARPVEGNRWIDLADERLHAGESTSVDIEFEATDEISGWTDLWREEDVADIWAEAELDYRRLFSNFHVKSDFKHEIEPT